MQIPPAAVRFAKGHGTQNDFVLLPDAEGVFDPSPVQVAAICDRRAGIGGDGLIRAVRACSLEAGRGQDVEWFMDYRNSDGSIAQMCGNGLRVFVTYLEHLGWVRLADGDEIAVGTRAGVKRVRRDGDLLVADLGPWRVSGAAPAAATGFDARVGVAGEPPGLPGLSIDVGNPHVVVALPDLERPRRGRPAVRAARQPDPTGRYERGAGRPLARRGQGTGGRHRGAAGDARARAGRGGDPVLWNGGGRRRARGPGLGGSDRS